MTKTKTQNRENRPIQLSARTAMNKTLTTISTPLKNVASLLTTDQAAQKLNLKRQQFQFFCKLLKIAPSARQKLSPSSRTPANFYDTDSLAMLAQFIDVCESHGLRAVMNAL